MKIGDLSRQTGVPVSALRFYESLGLLQSERTRANYRVFPPGMVEQVRRIQNFRVLNVSLPDIKKMLEMTRSPQESCMEVCDLIQGQLAEVGRQIHQLQQLEAELQRLASLCSGQPGPDGCKILGELQAKPGKC